MGFNWKVAAKMLLLVVIFNLLWVPLANWLEVSDGMRVFVSFVAGFPIGVYYAEDLLR